MMCRKQLGDQKRVNLDLIVATHTIGLPKHCSLDKRVLIPEKKKVQSASIHLMTFLHKLRISA